MIAPTRELATELNIRARTDRLAGPPTDRHAPTTTSATAPAPQGRRGDRRPPPARHDHHPPQRPHAAHHRTDFVKNGDRWTVTAHTTGQHAGRPDVVHLHTGRHLRLPADYVAEHVQLGYATTVHGAQGVTADTSHTVTAGAESRQQLYVALTRGRAPTTCTSTPPRTATSTRSHPGRHPPRDRAQHARADPGLRRGAATTTARHADDPGIALTQATARYLDSPAHRAADLLGADRMTAPWRPRRTDWPPGSSTSPPSPTPARPPSLPRRRGRPPRDRAHHRPA